MEYAGRILVRDKAGARFQIHEWRGRRMFKPVRRFILETGQDVVRLSFDSYVVGQTGEPLTRITS